MGGCSSNPKWHDRGGEWGAGPVPSLGGTETEAGDCTFSGPRVKATVPSDQASRGGLAACPATRPCSALKGDRDPWFALPFNTS